MKALKKELPELNNLDLKDLEEIYAATSGEYETNPVGINTFINDPYYLGNSFVNKETKKPDGTGLYEYWRPILNEIYPSPFYSPYYLINLRGCFSGDTLISTLNGHIPIKEIATRWFKGERDFWVLSWNIDTNSFEPDKVINAFSTGEEQLYEIILDNDEVIKCTANHKFLTKDNNWVSIDDGLVVNTSLKPYYWEESSGYHQIKADGDWEYRYNIVSKWKSCKEKGIHTHHKDFNKLNDNPSNISLLTKKQHLKIHADNINLYHNKWRKQIGEEEYLRLAKERLKNASDLLWHDTSYSESRDRHRASLSNHMKTSGQSQKMGQKGGQVTGRRNITKYNKSKQGREESVKRASHMRDLLERKTDEEKRLIKLKQGLGTLRGLKNRCLKCKEVKEGYCKEHTQKIEKKLNEIRKLDVNYNHSVIKIKRLQIEPVFDITTEKNHNFTLSSGVIAHNSIGSGKTSIGAVITAYEIYLQLCKVNPQTQYGLMPDTKLIIFIFNILLTLASDVTWSTLSALFVKSPFFQSLLELKSNASPEDKLKWPKHRNTLFPKNIDIRVGSNITHTLGQCLTCAIFDEIAFGVLTNQVTKALNSAIGRIRSRLGATDEGILNGKVVLISSESDVGSEMNKIMNKYKTDPGVLIVSDPLWKIKPEQFSKTTFPVFIGSDSKQPEIITENNQYLLDSEPQHILQVPTSCRREVTQDIHIFLRDIGGIATASSYKLFRLRDRVYKSLTMTNIFPEINALDFDDPDKNILFKRCTHPSYFKKPFYPNKPRHVHIDLGITEDRCGIACGYIPEFLQRSTLEDHEDPEKIFDIIPKINYDFAFTCVPTSGKRLPIYRLKEFLFYLRDELEYPIMSVSLDGFQCFTGDTKISLLNGTEIMIKDLVGKDEFWVYSCDSNGNVVPGRGHSARITGKQAKILKVTLDNGKEIRCTENHRFMLRDGTYKEAQYLTVNDSLMPLYRQQEFGYAQHSSLKRSDWVYTHVTIAKHFNPNFVSGSYDSKNHQVVHHLDRNKLNNSPTNLVVCKNASEHMKKYHLDIMKKMQAGLILKWADPEWKKQHSIKVSKGLKKFLEDPIERSKRKAQYAKAGTKGALNKERRKNASVNCTKRNTNPETSPRKKRWLTSEIVSEKFNELKSISKVAKFFNVHGEVIRERLKEINQEIKYVDKKQLDGQKSAKRLNQDPETYRKRCYSNCLRYGKTEEQAKVRALELTRNKFPEYNHSIIKIEFCGYEDVYDIEVDKYHNFALTAGVFVHNSESTLQDFKRAGFNAFLISVDRTANPYLQYRTAVYEGRIIHPKSQLLGSELVELEISPDGKKVDHPQLDVKGDKASKDISDCTCAINHQLHTNLEDYRNAELYTAIEDGALDEADEYEEILNELDNEFKSYTVMDQLFHKE